MECGTCVDVVEYAGEDPDSRLMDGVPDNR